MTSQALAENLEKWESTIEGTIFVNKFDPTGPPGSTTQEVVRGGRQFLITPEERNLLNSGRCENKKKDPFFNGHLRPVVVKDLAAEVADQQSIIQQEAQKAAAPNPNHASDEELLGLFEIRNHLSFRKAVEQITSAQTLRRLMALAGSDDANATVSQNNIVREALEAAADEGGVEVIEIEQPGRIGNADEGDDRAGFIPLKI